MIMSVGALVHRPKSQAKLIFFVMFSKMRRQIAAALCAAVLCAAVLGVTASSSLAVAQQKTAKACLDAWQASKAANRANGITQKAYVAQCRARGTPIQAAAAPATPDDDRTPSCVRGFALRRIDRSCAPFLDDPTTVEPIWRKNWLVLVAVAI